MKVIKEITPKNILTTGSRTQWGENDDMTIKYQYYKIISDDKIYTCSDDGVMRVSWRISEGN